MKKIITDTKTLAALLMAGAALAACSGDDNIVEELPATPAQHTYTMTIEATKGGDAATTRALALNGKTLNATWQTTDEVAVYNHTKEAVLEGHLSPQSNGASATLTGSLTGSVAKDDVVYLYWPSVNADYTGQDGTLETIAQRYDYTTGVAKVTSVNSTAIVAEDSSPSGGPVLFTNNQAIVKFTLIGKTFATPINATQLTIDAKVNGESRLIQSITYPSTQTLGPITINRTTPTDNVIYAALPFSSEAKFTFALTATDGKYTYTYEKADVTMLNGRYYEVTVRMNDAQPLTFEAREAGASVTFKVNTEVATNGVEYSTDGSSWAAYTPYTPITLENVGDRVMFRGNNAAYATASDNGDNCEFSCTKPCYIYGNIMSLITPTGFEKATTLTEPYTFKYLFDYNNNIDIHPIQKLLLPATTLTEKCYYCMFRSCYGLTKAPELPAMTMAKACYSKMFHNCTALVETPYLPATTLADDCYSEMFESCSSLKTPPAILPATTLAGSCYNKMFAHCNNLERAPYLPATQLIGACYYMMFYDCKKINSITCLATNFYGDCIDYWLYGVASDGTFYKASSATWTRGVSGIPEGWTVEETTHL
jgi:hypothetical protein